MEAVSFDIGFDKLKLNAGDLFRVMGYREDDDLSLVEEMTLGIFAELPHLCTIKAGYVVYDEVTVSRSERSVNLKGITFQVGPVVASMLRKSESIGLFLSTAGSEIEIKSRQASAEGDLLKGYIYDIAGSGIADAAADYVHSLIGFAAAGAGMKITNRYSPGYCGWDVAQQKELFSLLPNGFCGVSLNASQLMNPVKSVSGIIGIGKDVNFHPYTCDKCTQNNCTYRKTE